MRGFSREARCKNLKKKFDKSSFSGKVNTMKDIEIKVKADTSKVDAMFRRVLSQAWIKRDIEKAAKKIKKIG